MFGHSLADGVLQRRWLASSIRYTSMFAQMIKFFDQETRLDS